MKTIKRKNISISIGIPAFNEGANVEHLIQDLLAQELSKDKELREILVVSDGSTDNTKMTMKKITDKRVKFFAEEKREGKNKRLNQIFSKSVGDVLVILDADVLLDGKRVIDTITNPFVENKQLGLVAGNVQPLRGKSLAAKAFNNYVASLNFIKSNIRQGNNVFSVRGPLLALSRNFARKVKPPKNVPDDRYLYLACMQEGFTFVYEKRARVFFKSPENIEEQVSQGLRYKNQRESLDICFDSELIKKEYAIPVYLKVFALFLQIARNPFAYITMKYIQLKVLSTNNNTTDDKWSMTNSTKVANI